MHSLSWIRLVSTTLAMLALTGCHWRGNGTSPPDKGSLADAAPAVPDVAADPEVAGSPPKDPELDACWPGRWCWLEGAEVVAIDAASPDAVYAADRAGRLFRWSGATWEVMPGIRERRVHRVYVAARNDVWAITEHRDEAGFFVDRFDGTTWSTLRGAADPGFLIGRGSDNVWIREAETRTWLRFDGALWQRVPDFDATRYGTVATGVVGGRIDAMLLPGRAPEAFALTEGGASPTVMRYDGERWESMGDLGNGWVALSWAGDELRVVAHDGDGTGTGSAELRYDGTRWTRVREAPEGHYFLGTHRGIMVSPADRRCDLGVPLGTASFCALDRTIGILDEGAWRDTLLPQATRPFADALFTEVAPAYWAPDAHSAWGESPASYLRLRNDGDAIEARPLERVLGGVASTVLVDGRPAYAVEIEGVVGEAAWAFEQHRPLRVRGTVAEPVLMPSGLNGYDSVMAIAPTPGDSAWLVTGVDFFENRSSIIRIEGSNVRSDHTFSFADFADAVILHDVVVRPGGDVWVLGAIGHREGRGVLYHRELDGSWREIALGTNTSGPQQLASFGDALYITQSQYDLLEVLRIPLSALEGDTVLGDLADYRLLESETARFPGQRLLASRLWVGASGVWLTSETFAARYVER